MCGIAGIFNINGSSVSMNILKQMTGILKHRGPDGEGFWNGGFIGFGHRRLAVIDVSEAGAQPMISEDGSIFITYNGEVYNYKEIRKELKKRNYSFKSNTDTEVILKAYQEWGQECVKMFNGMFAFAIWDKNKNELNLFRDRYGIIPVYYYFKNGVFIFSSEIKSILVHPEVKKNVCLPALNEYFSFQNIFTDLTLFEGIKILSSGSYISIIKNEVDSFSTTKYWEYSFNEQNSLKDERELITEFTGLFEKAVTGHLISDVEIGAYLSGGIDSGAITCIAAKNFKDLKSFTCGFDLSSASIDEMNFDERGKAEFLSNLYKTEHYEIILKAGDMERIMEDLIWSLEDLRIGQCYPNYYVSRLAGKFVKVALSGTGGDELFGGYPWRYYRALVNQNIGEYAEKYYRYWQRLIPDRFKSDFFLPDIFKETDKHPTIEVFAEIIKRINSSNKSEIKTPEEYINLSLNLEARTFMHGLLMIDNKLGMAHGLETRVPFLDNDLVDFALKLPVKYKLKNINEIMRINENEPGIKTQKFYNQTGDGKIILRNALKKYVPDYYTQFKKQGFSAPDASWFRNESENYLKSILFNKNAGIYNFLSYDFVKKIIENHLSGKENKRLLIWSLLSFEIWLKKFFSEY